MKKLLAVCSALLCGALLSLNAQADAYIRGASQPWGESTNEAAMDAVFGAGNWDDLRMADGVAPFLPGSGHNFIFLEGGDNTANELDTYLNTYRTEIEAFVTAGGTLLLNAAPNEGGNIDFGFGGVTLLYGGGSTDTDDVEAADPNHPIFFGIATSYSGNSFGHALIGGGLTPLIIGAPGDANAGETVLAEMAFGSGLVLFGGMTTSNFHDPQPDADTLRANIIAYTSGNSLGSATQVPTMSAYGLVLTMLGLLLVASRRLRASARRT